MNSSSENKIGSKPPKAIIFFFALILVIASFNLFTDFSSIKGFRPFGFIEDIAAQVFRPAPNRGDILRSLRGGEPIEDSFDRCEIIDPNLPEPKRRTKVSDAGLGSASILGDNMGGANMALWLNQNDRELNKKTIEYSVNLGMSYNLAMVTRGDSAAVLDSAEFITESTEAGLMPIIRLCYAGNCEFNSPSSIISFYERLAMASNYEFIAIVGPNEPGTGGSDENPGMYEGAGFVSGFSGSSSQYDQLVNQTNDIARALQSQRGSKMYLAPAIFNLTNTKNNDVKNYLYEGATIDPSLYDYLMGNIYAELDIADPYEVYQKGAEKPYGLGEYADKYGLDVIITEFGIFNYNTPPGADMDEVVNRPERPELLAKAKAAFKDFCDDDNVLGVLFFRSFMYDNLEKLHPSVDSKHAMTPGEHAEIIDGCSKKGGFRDFAWSNCNFDSCIYDDDYSSVSTAKVCGTEYDNPERYTKENGAALEIGCSESGGCSASMVGTVQVRAPVKSFGSNSSSGTESRPYIPVCAELAAVVDGSTYDSLNQFAGKLKGGSITNYPMPWLGSALNCAAKLSLMRGDNADDLTAAERFNPSLGSRIDQTQEEVTSDWEAKFKLDGPQNQFKNLVDYQIDERTLCLVNKQTGKKECMDKVNVSSLTDWHVYNPYNIPSNTEATTCGEDTRYFSDKSNYIIGPELKVSESVVYSGSTSQVCQMYANRKNGKPSDIMVGIDYKNKGSTKLDCTIKNMNIYVPAINQTVYCPKYLLDNYNCTNENIQNGTCAFYPIDSELYKCLDYKYKSTDDVFYKTDAWPDNPDFEIPGIYDALYQMYVRVQDNLEGRDRKILFRENIAWKFEVDSIVRDAARQPEAGEPPAGGSGYENWYTQSLSSCEVPSNLYTGENYLAKNNPIRREYQYYDWLGYVDILQEISSVYLDDDTISPESWVANPSFGSSDVPTLKDRVEVLISGTSDPLNPEKVILGSSNLLLSYPLYTCDELEAFNAKYGLSLKMTCITDRFDDRFTDELGEFLCSKGYPISGLCEAECKVEVAGNFKNATCPIEDDKCYQGPFGSFSHACSAGGSYLGDFAFDLYNTSNEFLYAPEDGEIISVVSKEQTVCNNSVLDSARDLYDFNKSRGASITSNMNLSEFEEFYNTNIETIRSLGGYINYKGDSGTFYRLTHLEITKTDKDELEGVRFTGGDQIATKSGKKIKLYHTPGNVYTPCIAGSHLHTWAKFDNALGDYKDLYALYTDILGCNSTRSCQNDAKSEADRCEPAPWQEANVAGANDSPYLCTFDDSTDGSGRVAPADKKFAGVACLAKEIADYISENYQPIPYELILAIGKRESSLTNSQTRQPFSGDPSEKSHKRDGAIAEGPMQFTESTWNGIINNNGEVMLGCLKQIGFNVNSVSDITLDYRLTVGGSMCAAAIKLTGNANALIDGGTLSLEDWERKYLPPSIEVAVSSTENITINFYNTFDPQYGLISPIEYAAARYLGACNLYDKDSNGDIRFENGKPVIIATYCEDVYENFQSFKGSADTCGVPVRTNSDAESNNNQIQPI